MNQQWQAFLVSNGAQFDGQWARFDAVDKEILLAAEQTVLIALTQLGVIRSQGSDSAEFLQSQLSNDIHALDAGHSQLAAYCNPKGRMLAQFRVIPGTGDEHLLVLNRELMDNTLKRLRMFVLRSQVTLEDMSDELICMGLVGDEAASLLKAEYGTVPEAVNEMTQSDGECVVRVADEPAPRFLIVAPLVRAMALWQRWSDRARLVGGNAWEWLDIQAGLPSLAPETVEAFVPLMLNLQHLNGVSFKKGCYPGQEIIARTHYLGKIKRRMYRAHTPSANHPEPGTEIVDASGGEQSAGTVVNAQPAPEGGYDLLVVLQVSAEAGELQLGPDGSPLALQSLPYSLEQAS